MAILAEIKDPRVRDVTVTHVEVSGDLRLAKVYVSIMGEDTRQQLCLRGLQSSVGFLQAKVGKRIDTRYTPKLEFVLDLGVKRSIEIARVLNDVLPKPCPADVPLGEQHDDESDQNCLEQDFLHEDSPDRPHGEAHAQNVSCPNNPLNSAP